jgi:hypothetical protein
VALEAFALTVRTGNPFASDPRPRVRRGPEEMTAIAKTMASNWNIRKRQSSDKVA